MSAVGRLVVRLSDDQPRPLVGEVVAELPGGQLLVVWGDARRAVTEQADELRPCDRAG